MKVETVSRGREIAEMQEAISNLKKEKEVEKNKKVPKKDKVVQTDLVVGKMAATQTTVRTYAGVAAQVEGVSQSEGGPTDKIDIDPPGSPKSSKKPQSSQGRTPMPKPTQCTHIWPSCKGLYGVWGCLPWTLAGTYTGGRKSIWEEGGGSH